MSLQRRSEALAALRAVLEAEPLALRPARYAKRLELLSTNAVNRAELESSGPRRRLYTLHEHDGEEQEERQTAGVRAVELPVDVIVHEAHDGRRSRLAQKLDLHDLGELVLQTLHGSLADSWRASTTVTVSDAPTGDAFECRVPGVLLYLRQALE